MRVAILVFLPLLAGCGPLAEGPDAEGLSPVIGMANPASVSCIDSGGRSEIQDSPTGQIGVCIFRDGRRCEEWALFRDRRCVAP